MRKKFLIVILLLMIGPYPLMAEEPETTKIPESSPIVLPKTDDPVEMTPAMKTLEEDSGWRKLLTNGDASEDPFKITPALKTFGLLTKGDASEDPFKKIFGLLTEGDASEDPFKITLALKTLGLLTEGDASEDPFKITLALKTLGLLTEGDASEDPFKITPALKTLEEDERRLKLLTGSDEPDDPVEMAPAMKTLEEDKRRRKLLIEAETPFEMSPAMKTLSEINSGVSGTGVQTELSPTEMTDAMKSVQGLQTQDKSRIVPEVPTEMTEAMKTMERDARARQVKEIIIAGYHEKIMIEQSGKAKIYVTVIFSAQPVFSLSLPILTSDGVSNVHFKIPQGGFATNIISLGDRSSLVIDLNSPSLEGQQLFFDYEVNNFWGAEDRSKKDLDAFVEIYRFVNNSHMIIEHYSVELILPEGKIFGNVVKTSPAIATGNSEIKKIKNSSALILKEDSHVILECSDLKIGDRCELKYSYRSEHRSLFPLIGGILLSLLYLWYFRNRLYPDSENQ